MEIISSLLMIPFFCLWGFVLWWLIKPKYFPFFTTASTPSRLTVLGIMIVFYLVLTSFLVLGVDTSDSAEEIVVSDLQLATMLFSIALLVLLGFWSKYAANKRQKHNQSDDEPLSLTANKQISNTQKHQLITRIAELVADLHQQGNYHGDINPNTIVMDNYMVSDIEAPDSHSNLLLSNLSLAKPMNLSITKKNDGIAANKTDFKMLGNPAYQAPERWQAQSANEQSDIYAFGIMVYEILTGDLPFTIDNTSSDPMLDWNNQHCLTPIPKLAKKYEAYQPLIDKTLAKQKKKRYESMGEVISDLQSLNSH